MFRRGATSDCHLKRAGVKRQSRQRELPRQEALRSEATVSQRKS